MKRALAWLAGLVGIAALGRWLSRRRRPADAPAGQAPAPAAGDPAADLRRKLADQRGPDTVEDPAPSGPTATAPEQAEPLEERRARVHAKAREAIEAMDDRPAT